MTSHETLSYIRTVEQLFLVLRRQGLMLSPLDLQLARSWAEMGVPLRVVCRAIIDVCDRYRDRFGRDKPLPTSLRYFSAAVLEEAGRYQAQTLPIESTDEDIAAHETRTAALNLVDQLLEELILIGQSEPEPGVRKAYRKAYRGLIRLRHDLLLPEPPALLPRLAQLDAQLLADVWIELPESTRLVVRQATETEVEMYRDKLGVRALEEKRQTLWEHMLGKQLDLFRLWDPDNTMPIDRIRLTPTLEILPTIQPTSDNLADHPSDRGP